MKVALLSLGGSFAMAEDLSDALHNQGCSVVRLSADTADTLPALLDTALADNDAVMLTAPLGKNGDAAVRQALSDYLHAPLRVSERAKRHIAAYCTATGRDAGEYSDFALFPAKSRAILGKDCICGCICAAKDKLLFLLPQKSDEAMLAAAEGLISRFSAAMGESSAKQKSLKTSKSAAAAKPKRHAVGFGVLNARTRRICAAMLILCAGVLGVVGWRMSGSGDDIVAVTDEVHADVRLNLLKPETLIDVDIFDDDDPEHGGTEIPDDEEDVSTEEEPLSTEDYAVSTAVSTEPSAASSAAPPPQSSETPVSSEPESVSPPPESEPSSETEPSSDTEEEPSSEAESESESEEPSSSEEEESEPSSEEEEEDDGPDYDPDETLTVKVNGKVVEMDAYELLCQAITNEIGTSFATEAIKAQTVAAYTFIKFNNSIGSYPSVGLKTCTSSHVREAVASVLGEAVYYNGRYANTVYHSISAGETTSAAEVWGGSYPYLVSVDSSWDENVSSWQKTYSIDSDSFASRVEAVYGIDLYDYSDDPDDWVEIESYNSGGYVGTVSLGGSTTGKSGGSYGRKTITGRSIRETLLGYKLRSHCFDVSYDSGSDRLVFTTYGYGHGVGMSQWGAQMMALEGYDYVEILEHYYTGVTVE